MGKGGKKKKREKSLCLGLLQNANFSLQSRNCTKNHRAFQLLTPPKRGKKDKEKKKIAYFLCAKIKGFAIIESKSLEGFLHFL